MTDLKRKYEIFQKNEKDINNRILLALDLNPFNDNTKLDWESFIRFKRIVIQNENNLQENVEFLINVNQKLNKPTNIFLNITK